uniref:Uncharacterized protein n=1 Tax=Oryza sativa subsp. japonica TaxID=39947 RepID=Q69QG8_ORYSJ|nr:hypothetical protein [Oryza sativa Japonica Group]
MVAPWKASSISDRILTRPSAAAAAAGLRGGGIFFLVAQPLLRLRRRHGFAFLVLIIHREGRNLDLSCGDL